MELCCQKGPNALICPANLEASLEMVLVALSMKMTNYITPYGKEESYGKVKRLLRV